MSQSITAMVRRRGRCPARCRRAGRVAIANWQQTDSSLLLALARRGRISTVAFSLRVLFGIFRRQRRTASWGRAVFDYAHPSIKVFLIRRHALSSSNSFICSALIPERAELAAGETFKTRPWLHAP